VRSIAISLSVCLSVCLFDYLFVCPSARLSLKPHVQISPNFLWILHMAVPRSFDGNAIHRVLSVLWIMSCFHIMEQMGQNQRRRVCFVQFARRQCQGAKSVVSGCNLLSIVCDASTERWCCTSEGLHGTKKSWQHSK